MGRPLAFGIDVGSDKHHLTILLPLKEGLRRSSLSPIIIKDLSLPWKR